MARPRMEQRPNRVRMQRVLAEVTQAELAERVGVSRQTIVSIEAGDYGPSVYLAIALADALDTTVDHLFRIPHEEPT
jgi:putative transcriptional regulator